MTDIEIASSIEKEDIIDIAKKINLKPEDIILYGNDKAKIKNYSKSKNAKLVLVTATSPTPYGEGKTTVSIGLLDALCKLNKSAVGVLREPSMGPVFGIKGGATGGGYSQVVPMEDINLHFTGDFHAITAANNLLAAAIDNHIYHGNELNIKEVVFKRCLDVNDRALRAISLKTRDDGFNITAASELMALFCLATSLDDLKEKINNIIIGLNSKNEYIYAKDLNVADSLVVILKDAFLPNLVQTLEANPVIIHGGPFANIAHGCNSIVAEEIGLSVADYVITEAGFGSDLGAQKFFDIKCKRTNKTPDCVVLVTTIRSLYYNGNGTLSLDNLKAHIENIKLYTSNLVVCINKFSEDKEEDIDVVLNYLAANNIKCSISEAYIKGGAGALDVASEVIKITDGANDFKFLYEKEKPLTEALEIICKKIYHASNIIYTAKAQEKINILKENGIHNLPICVAKTQYSLSDEAKKLGDPRSYDITVSDINLYNGAGFITVLMGNIMTMPGLSKHANYEKIRLDEEENIIGLF